MTGIGQARGWRAAYSSGSHRDESEVVCWRLDDDGHVEGMVRDELWCE